MVKQKKEPLEYVTIEKGHTFLTRINGYILYLKEVNGLT